MIDRSTGMTPEEAKALAAGDLGQEMAKYPLRFCKPLFFGPPPSPAQPVEITNGTMSLLKAGKRFLGLTCEHLIREYQNKKKEDESCSLSLANLQLDDPLSLLIVKDRAIDFAIFEFTSEQAQEVIKDSDGIGEAFYEIGPRVPAPIEVGDFVAYGGFPGELRKPASFDELNFGSYSSGACRVVDRHSDYFTCGFEREYWARHFSEPEPRRLGGLSGGPVFAIRHSSAGFVTYEFTGYVFKIHEPTEALFVRHVSAIWDILSQ
ncbi:MAG: hypothetical protein IH996_08700 [Proteobacteria bacterium]|nr:hypothetical protein [Pseudomonadota bacterium]